ncbi:Uncharacterised protein [Actinobacillus equuli]|nr:Uncharacterised protein [Actinobacillus equuli]VEI48378.1 Uncharacterised protein [Actinobacillus equuli]
MLAASKAAAAAGFKLDLPKANNTSELNAKFLVTTSGAASTGAAP